MNRIHTIVASTIKHGKAHAIEFKVLATDVEGYVDVVREQQLVLAKIPPFYRVERVHTEELKEPAAFLLGYKEAL